MRPGSVLFGDESQDVVTARTNRGGDEIHNCQLLPGQVNKVIGIGNLRHGHKANTVQQVNQFLRDKTTGHLGRVLLNAGVSDELLNRRQHTSFFGNQKKEEGYTSLSLHAATQGFHKGIDPPGLHIISVFGVLLLSIPFSFPPYTSRKTALDVELTFTFSKLPLPAGPVHTFEPVSG